MYARRTVRTCVSYGGVLGCLLVAVPSLAAVNPNGFEVLSSKTTGVKSGQYIEAAVSAVYRHGGTAGNQGVYTKQMVPVATSTLRKGAIATLGRGLMHPGLQVAILAAGWVWSQQDGIQYEDVLVSSTEYNVPDDYKSGGSWHVSAPSPGVYLPDPASAMSYIDNVTYGSLEPKTNINIVCLAYDNGLCGRYKFSFSSGYSYSYTAEWAPSPPDYQPDQVVYTDVPESDYPMLDQHIPPDLYDQLWNDGPIPEWQDEITVLGAPATYVQPTGDQAVAPEVASQIGKWGENVGAQLDGEPLPNPETDADGKTSTDSLYEELGLDDPVPDYPEPDVAWQTEELELPAYSSGIAEGQCPPPAVIPMPLGGGEIGWSYQPACDLASMARPAFLGACGLIALLIVLRARGGSD